MRRSSADRDGSRVRRDWARVVRVTKRREGRPLTAPAAAGTTALEVRNGAIFGSRGWVQVGDQVTRHTGWDEDTEILTVVDPLEAAAEVDDRVLVYDRGRETAVTDLVVLVDRDGEGGAPLEAYADATYLTVLPVGPREDDEGEVVRIEYDADEDVWMVTAVPGLADGAGIRWEDHDPYTPTASDIAIGTFVHELAHGSLIDKSLEVRVNGIAIDTDRYVVDVDAGLVTVTLAGWETTDDAYSFHYQHLQGSVRQQRTRLSIPIGATWRYATGLPNSPATYADPDFDDTTWDQGASGFGWGSDLTNVGTVVGSPMSIWTRTEATSGGRDVTINALIDNSAAFYIDGVLVWAPSYSALYQNHTVSLSPGEHVIAVRGNGDGITTDKLIVAIEEAV